MNDKKPTLVDELFGMPGVPCKLLVFTLPREPDLPFRNWNGGRNKIMATADISIVWHPRHSCYLVIEKTNKKDVEDTRVVVPFAWAAAQF